MGFSNERKFSGVKEMATFMLDGATVTVASTLFKLKNISFGVRLFSININLNHERVKER